MEDERSNLDEYLAGLGISEDQQAPSSLPSDSDSPLPDVQLDEKALLENFFQGLIDRIDPVLTVSISEATDDTLLVAIAGVGAERLAGRYGETLHALELLAYTVINKQAGRSHWRVRVDAGGFRRRHERDLTLLAERISIQVAKSGESHELQPMPAADRRIMHIALKENPDVYTESIGEGDSRRLIIKPRY